MAEPTLDLSFWILARERDISLAKINRETWLRKEHSVALCVANPPPNVAALPDVHPLRIARSAPMWAGSMLDGEHPRIKAAGVNASWWNASQPAIGSLAAFNGFLRAKVKAMVQAICASGHAFSVIMDEDTAFNTTNLRRWIRAHTNDTRGKAMLYAGSGTRGIGGGPGIVLSQGAAQRLCATHCPADIGNLGALGGGDHWLAECSRRAMIPRTVSPLFSPAPPWYHSIRYQRAELDRFVSFHRVRPVAGNYDFLPDPRCRVLSRGLRAWQTHRCLPHFAVIGTPKSGTTSMFGYLVQHPEVVSPRTKELHVFAPIVRGPRSGLNITPTNYTDKFPHIDPRSFTVTGDASPATLYHPFAAKLLLHQMHVRCIILLRHPVQRMVSEFENKRHNPLWIGRHPNLEDLLNHTVVPAVRDVARLFACRREDCVHPVVWQSWYDLFLPRWFDGRPSPLIIFADDFFRDEQATLDRVTYFLEIGRFRFNVDKVFNNHEARGVAARGPNALKTLAKNASSHTCERPRVLLKAQALMRASLLELQPMLRSYASLELPNTWWSPPTCD